MQLRNFSYVTELYNDYFETLAQRALDEVSRSLERDEVDRQLRSVLTQNDLQRFGLQDSLQSDQEVGGILSASYMSDGSEGKVVPMASVPLSIEADILTADGTQTIYGQNSVAKSNADISRIRIIPPNPPAPAEAVTAIQDAEWVIFGPGSWYTSVIPHLMVPDLHDAFIATAAKKMLVINLVADSETSSMSPADHVRSFYSHSPDLSLDVILVDEGLAYNAAELEAAAALCGAKVVAAPVANYRQRGVHDPLHLAAAYREIFASYC